MSANRLGSWSASAVFVIGVAYLVTLAAGFAVHGLAEPIVDPILAIMEVLTLMSAPLMVVMMAAIHDGASGNRKIYHLRCTRWNCSLGTCFSALHYCSPHQYSMVAVRNPVSERVCELAALSALPVSSGP
jgi:hypothetical protein